MNSSERMSDSQTAKLAGAICATGETLGQTISASAAKMMAEDLADYAPMVVREALRACRRELTGKLTLAAILQRVNAADGRPSANEAWSLAVESFDEHQSVVLTPEILQASAIASPIYRDGDKVGARMAFIGAYERAVVAARAEGADVEWSLSLGRDQAGRALAVDNAVRIGRIPADKASALLEQHLLPAITSDGAAIAGLLTGNGVAPSANLQEKWRELKKSLQEKERERASQRARDAEIQREALSLAKEECERAIEAHVASVARHD